MAKTLDKRIKDIMGSSILAPFFIVEGLNITMQVIDQLSDEQLYKQFGGLYHAQDIRKFYRAMHEKLNDNS
jgi:hypothetical protein